MRYEHMTTKELLHYAHIDAKTELEIALTAALEDNILDQDMRDKVCGVVENAKDELNKLDDILWG